LLPIEINLENPNSRSAAKSRTAVQSAPLCEIKDILPGAGMRAEKLAFNFTAVSGLITPKQFGPTRRILAFWQMAMICFSI